MPTTMSRDAFVALMRETVAECEKAPFIDAFRSAFATERPADLVRAVVDARNRACIACGVKPMPLSVFAQIAEHLSADAEVCALAAQLGVALEAAKP